MNPGVVDPEIQPRCRPKVAMADAVIALTTNIAARQGRRIEFQQEWFDPDHDATPENPENNKNERATIAMANAGPNTGSSQFFINGAYNIHLDNIHPVFGDVIEGIEVVDSILNVDTSGEPLNQPLENVTLIKATFID